MEIFKKYDSVALPVVDGRGVLVGMVTVDDVLDVAEEETTEDFQKVTGMGVLEYSYFGTGYLAMLRKRLPWLMLLLLEATSGGAPPGMVWDDQRGWVPEQAAGAAQASVPPPAHHRDCHSPRQFRELSS